MMKRALTTIGFLLFCGPTFAACPSPYVLKDGNANNQNAEFVNNSNANCEPVVTIGDGGGTAANKLSINGSGQAAIQAPPSLPLPTGAATAANQTAVADPCMYQAKTPKNINTATGTTLLVAASGSTKVYVCSFAIVVPSAVSVSLSEGTGATCNTANQAGVMGVAVNGTAANGMPFAANGSLTYGNGGSTVALTATAGNALCLFQSGTAQLAGNITYVQQ